MKFLFLLSIIIIALQVGCVPEHPCGDSNLTPVFVNFRNSDIDTIVLRAYQPNDSFNHLIDTALLISAYIPNLHHDSAFIDVGGSYTDTKHYEDLSPNFDWEIYLPVKRQTIFISKIVNLPQTGKGRYCTSVIKSYNQNGVLVNPIFTGYIVEPYYPIGYMIYINNN